MIRRNIDIIARQLDGPAFDELTAFGDRYKARRRAMRIVENDHHLAITLMALSNLSSKG